LGDITTIISGNTPSKSDGQYWDGDIVWVTPTDVTSVRGKYIDDSAERITQAGLENSSATLIEPGAVLMTSRATIGEAVINKVPATTNQGFKTLVPSDVLDTDYLYYYINRLKPYLNAIGGGSTFSEVSKADVSGVRIALPPLSEQRRIADALSTVDERIQEEGDAVRKTENLKRGLMQDLLIQGIGHEEYAEQYLGPRRLEVPAEWEKARLGEVTEIITRGKQPTYVEEGGVPVLNQSCIYWDGFHPEELKRLDSEVASSWKDKYWVKNGDVLINSTGKGTLGRALEWTKDSDTHALDSHITRVHPDETILDPTYLRFYLESNHGQKMLYTFCVAGSTGQIELSKTDLQTMPVLLPPIDEQRAISEAFHRANSMMSAAQEEKENLHKLKIGLMQDLLTGNRRLKADT
jgi:type I restriction enzyme S subunit